ncbi:MAG: hypothetical protein J0G30_05330 [Actinomycetales bacterium]|nr:hypothetical protein [Actinomycetales bacterium]
MSQHRAGRSAGAARHLTPVDARPVAAARSAETGSASTVATLQSWIAGLPRRRSPRRARRTFEPVRSAA